MGNDNAEFSNIIYDLVENPTVNKMRNFRQHCDTSCYDHCVKVSYYSYLICKKYNLDYQSAARAGMLHDLFLYDWRLKHTDRTGLHGFTHPKTAFENASKLFLLNKKEKDIILKHMWPLTLKLPKYKESYIVSFVDKYCAFTESFRYYIHWFKMKKVYRYAYLLLCISLIRL